MGGAGSWDSMMRKRARKKEKEKREREFREFLEEEGYTKDPKPTPAPKPPPGMPTPPPAGRPPGSLPTVPTAPASPAVTPVIPQAPGMPLSGAAPGNIVSELTPNPWLPAFVPNLSAFFQPQTTFGTQPSYSDPNWFRRAESAYPGAISMNPLDYYGGGAASAQPLSSGLNFGFDQRGPIGGGMLGMMGKGLTPRAIGGMLSRGYFG